MTVRSLVLWSLCYCVYDLAVLSSQLLHLAMFWSIPTYRRLVFALLNMPAMLDELDAHYLPAATVRLSTVHDEYYSHLSIRVPRWQLW